LIGIFTPEKALLFFPFHGHERIYTVKDNIMDRCLDDNEITLYTDYLCLGSNKPNQEVICHVADCFDCKVEILEVCEILDQLSAEII
jgi:hypothetical protein